MSPRDGRRRRAGREERGSLVVDIAPVILVLMLFTLATVQLALVLWSALEASSAARVGGRVAAISGDAGRARAAAAASLPPVLRDNAPDIRPAFGTETTSVGVRIPVVIPFGVELPRLTQTATFDVAGQGDPS